jgi:hypothetical protein
VTAEERERQHEAEARQLEALFAELWRRRQGGEEQ